MKKMNEQRIAKIVLIAAALIVLLLAASAASAETQISQNGISWTFDGEVKAGQFFNGDWWVIGPVTIVSITPAYVDVDGREMNGSQINPTNTWQQGYDSGADWYDPDINAAIGISKDTPLTVDPASSVVSTISLETPTRYTFISDAAVLTVLASPPAVECFRPPYCGDQKELIAVSAVDPSVLKNYAAPDDAMTLSRFENKYDRVRIDHAPIPHGQDIRPHNNFSSVYGREIAKDAANCALILNCDYPTAEKEYLLLRYIQYGIDLYGITQADGEGWHGDGGHSGGRKLPILFAGKCLNHAGMMSIGDVSGCYLYSGEYGPGDRPPDYKDFGEDAQTFYVSDFEVAMTHADWWQPDSRDEAIPYETSDIGLPEWSQTHSHAPKKCTNWWDAKYRQVAGCTMPGTALAARAMGVVDEWNNPAFFDYCDRYMNVVLNDPNYASWQHGTNGVGESVIELWKQYRYAADEPDIVPEPNEPPPAEVLPDPNEPAGTDPNGWQMHFGIDVDLWFKRL